MMLPECPHPEYCLDKVKHTPPHAARFPHDTTKNKMHTVSSLIPRNLKKHLLLLCALLPATAATAVATSQPDTTMIVAQPAPVPLPHPADTIVIIQSPLTTAPDDIYSDETTVVTTLPGDTAVTAIVADPFPSQLRSENATADLVRLGDTSHNVGIAEFAIPAGAFAAAALFVRTPKLVQAREYVQEKLSHHGKDKTPVDNYIQYAPMIVGYGLDFVGVKSQHNLLDRTILLAMSYATFGIVNYAAKTAFGEKRPDSNARNSFPSGHTGTVFMGAEYLRREYWHKSKWIGAAGYAVAISVGYLRIHNDRHWINDVVGGAALGYLSTTFAYWIYPKIFQKRVRMHRDELLQRITPEKKQKRIAWIASPFASDGAYGVAASISF